MRIEGLVATPRELTFADLAALPEQIADVSTLAPGPSGAAVRVRALLAAAGVRPGATTLAVSSRDGAFDAAVPLAAADSAVLVYANAGAPLPAALGGPLRFLIPDATSCGLPGVDACANVKDVGVLRVE